MTHSEQKEGFVVLKCIRYGIVLILILYTGMLFMSKGDSRVPFEKVEASVTKAMDISEMKKGDGRELKRLYGLNAREFEQVCLYYKAETMQVEELLVVRVQNERDAEAVTDAINRRKETQIDNFEGYGPEQVKLLESSVIKVRGRYILFVVSEKAENVEKAFNKSL